MEKMAHLFSFKASRKTWLTPATLAIIGILGLGLFLRIYKIKDYIVFLGDEGRDALVVYNILQGDPTLLGPTSSVGGFFLGPIYYYMMAPFLWLFNYDPVGPAIMVVIIGVITIFLVYLVAKDFFGIKAGLIAALLYAISPIIILYSRSSWNPNVFPFFTILSLYSLYKAVVNKKWWLFVLAGFLMGINLQIHYLATFVGAIMFFYVLFSDFRLKINWVIETIKRYLLMLVGFLIGFSPFLLFEIRHQFKNTNNILTFILNSPDTGVSQNVFLNVEHVFERLFAGLLLSYPTLGNRNNYEMSTLIIWEWSGVIFGLIVFGFFAYNFFKNIKDKKSYQKYLLLFIWGLVGIGLFLFYKKSIYDYYLGFLYPLPYILIGFLFSSVIDRFKRPGAIAISAILVFLVLLNLKFTPIAVPGNQQVKQMQMISEFVLSKTDNKPYNFALSGSGNSDHAYRYFFRLAGKDPVVIKGLGEDPNRESVTDQLFVICEKVPCSPLGESSNDIAGFGRGEIEDEWDISVVKVYKIKHYTGE